MRAKQPGGRAGGRPPRSSDGPRTERVNVAFTPAERAELERQIEQYACAHPDQRRPSRMAMIHRIWSAYRIAAADPSFDAAAYFAAAAQAEDGAGSERERRQSAGRTRCG